MPRSIAWTVLGVIAILAPATLVMAPRFFPGSGQPLPLPEADGTHLTWLLVAAMLVFLMQIGFLTFESASVQPKNAQGVAVKNFLNFVAASGAYLLVGFGFMFGDSWDSRGFVGTTRFLWFTLTPLDYCLIAYQAGFAAVAATIVSSAMVERSRILSNVFFSFLVGALIYPLFGHWVWYPTGALNPVGWLGALGFHDFAGSSVVHCVGGFAALAGVLVLGPRRYEPGAFAGNLPLATIGVLFLWIGWIGFNGGSATTIEQIGRVILNTNLAAIGGGVASLVLVLGTKRPRLSTQVLLGSMGGLVAITAGSLRFQWFEAIVVGALAGIVTVRVADNLRMSVFHSEPHQQNSFIERLWVGHTICAVLGGIIGREMIAARWPHLRTLSFLAAGAGCCLGIVLFRYLWTVLVTAVKVDDPVDAIAVHGFAGAFGTVMVGVLGHSSLETQLIGVAVAVLWSFGVAYVTFKALDTLGWLRESEDNEKKGVGLEGLPFEPLPLWTQYDKLADLADKDALLTQKINDARESLARHILNVSHQILGPLRGARGLLHTSSGEATGSHLDAQGLALTWMDIAIFRVTNMDLLARLEDEKVFIDKSKFSIDKVAAEICRTFQPFAALRQQCELVLLDPRVHGSSARFRPGVSVRASKPLIEQALMNLLDNAIHYANNKSRIEIWIESLPTKIEVHVRNRGLVIRLEDRDKLYQRNYRSPDAPSRRADGSGIGLYLVKRIAELHEGHIALVSPSDSDVTEFCLSLPH